MTVAMATPFFGYASLAVAILGLLALVHVYASGRRHRQSLASQLEITAARLRETQRLASIAEFRWFVDTDRIEWSDAAFRLYGRALSAGQPSVNEAFGQIHPEDLERAQKLADALIAGGQPVSTEFRIVRGDGTISWIQATGEAVEEGGQLLLHGVQQDVTALASVRERLREAEEQYRFLFQHNPMPMWVFDRETLQFLAVNDAMTEHYGYSRAELLESNMLEIRPAEDREAVEAAARLRSVDRPQGKVWTHVRKDASRLRAAVFTRDIEFSERPARLVAAHDMTERESSELRFQLVARATNDAIWDWDLKKDVTWRSDNVYGLFGYEPGEIIGSMDGWADLLHPDDKQRVETSIRGAIDSSVESWECQYRLRRKDGSYAKVMDRGYFIRDAEGIATRAVGGMIDVTQKHRDEADLRLLRRAVESTDNGIVIADARQPDLPLIYANASFVQMTGYSAEEVMGSNCRFLQGTDHEQVGLQALRLAIAEQRETRVVLRNYRKDGTQFWNELHLAPVQDEDGRVSYFVGIQTDVSHRHHYEQELAHRATHDQLTGLPNRQLIMDRMQQAILNADRYGREAGVVFIDLDDFKLINDNLDHAAGDEALRIVAERLRGLIRETDTVGRFGGDEFVIVLTEQTDESGVGLVISRVSAALSAPMEIGGMVHTLTQSIGWCRYPEGGPDAETLLKHADMAMYQAKRQGRNRAVAYEPGFDAHVSQRLQLVAQLRDALERDEFELLFQPLYDAQDGPAALEALVRWRHSERGLLPPSEFIGVCEESGLIIPLGRTILREAARHHPLLVAAGYPKVRLAVNVSALQFGYALEEDVAAVVAEFSLPPGILELEITESVILDHPERAIEAMQRMSGMGVCLSVDDFGTGYSSLAYLRRLPIHRLKIDRSFVEDLPDDREAASICESIIGLAHSLQLQTVGEGVETPEQLAWLRDNGCDEVQGYLLARPLPFSEVLAKLSAGSPGAPA